MLLLNTMLAIIDNELVLIQYGYVGPYDIRMYRAKYMNRLSTVDAAIEHFEPLS